MPKPEPTENGATFDLAAVTEELRRENAYLREGRTARTLVRTPDLAAVLTVMKEGSHLPEHEARQPTSIHTVAGHLRLKLPDRTVDLPAGQLLVLARGLRHDVQAVVDSVFLLTLGGPPSEEVREGG